ncbi:MAG: hypothetical protein ACRDZ5_04035 [Acidimicrobiales bacterium]
MVDKSHDPKAEVSDLVGLLKSYVLQETVGPLKKLAITLAIGSGSAVLCGIGSVLLLVALLRALQGETGSLFAGEWSWAPYGLVVIAAVLALGLVAAVLVRSLWGRAR